MRLQLEKQVHLNPFSNRVLRLDVADEAAIAPLLEQVAMEYGSEVTLGSYPVSRLVAFMHLVTVQTLCEGRIKLLHGGGYSIATGATQHMPDIVR